MFTRSFFSPIFLLVILVESQLLAGTIPGRWEKIDSLEPGTFLNLQMDSGTRLECQFLRSDQKSVTVRDVEEADREIPKTAIRRIETIEKKRGPIWTGALIGAAIGAAASGIVIAAVDAEDVNAGPIVFFTAIGAGIGLGIDAAVAKPEVLYRAPKP
jgi:hypothetical protein